MESMEETMNVYCNEESKQKKDIQNDVKILIVVLCPHTLYERNTKIHAYKKKT